MSDLLKPGQLAGNGESGESLEDSGLELVIEARNRDLAGIAIRRVLPFYARRMVGPWIFFDHIGPVDFAPGAGMDVPPHPHINLATVTYVFEGVIMHRDSMGVVQAVEPGAINLMVAGKGVAHSERTPPAARASGFRQHALQLWLALPVEAEEIEPAFYHYEAGELPGKQLDGVKVRALIGECFGLVSPVKTYSQTLYAEADFAPGARLTLPANTPERAVYVVSGAVRLNGVAVAESRMAVCREGREITVEAEAGARIVIIGGENIGPRHIWWNFISSRPERIEQAKQDWKEQRFEKIPGETEVVPLPRI
jgi:redox-sensitive bicupin YhaK (pirin superfamily)